jgi:O-acetyl-ADP-ribose deacetylase (regulator of RNase III)
VCSIRFLKKLIDFVEMDKGTTKVHEDNSACVAVSTKPVHRSRSKHIGTKYHVVREASAKGELELVQVWTEHQTADLFTKSLPRDKFERFQSTLLGKTTFLEMQQMYPKPQAQNMVNGVLRCEKYQTSYAPESRKGSWVGYQVPKHQSFANNMAEWRSCITKKPDLEMPGYGRSEQSPNTSHLKSVIAVSKLSSCDEYAEHGLLYFVHGDLLQAKEQYIAHQSSCQGSTYEGLSAAIIQEYPHCDVFSKGLVQKTNICTPGEIYVSGHQTAKVMNDERAVITLYGQNYPGTLEQGTMSTVTSDDSRLMRQTWFLKCLDKIMHISDLKSIAFPYRIGCGTAGGSWKWYQQQLEKLAVKLPNVRIVVYMWAHTYFANGIEPNADQTGGVGFPTQLTECRDSTGKSNLSSGGNKDSADLRWEDNLDY